MYLTYKLCAIVKESAQGYADPQCESGPPVRGDQPGELTDPAQPVADGIWMNKQHPVRGLQRGALLQVGTDRVQQGGAAVPQRFVHVPDQLGPGGLVPVQRAFRQQVVGEYRAG